MAEKKSGKVTITGTHLLEPIKFDGTTATPVTGAGTIVIRNNSVM